MRKLPSSGGEATAASLDKTQAQSTDPFSSGAKREVGKLGAAGPLHRQVVVEHAGPSVRLAKHPASVPPSNAQPSMSRELLDSSGTTVATDKSSTENLLAKVTIREADTSSDEDNNDPATSSTAPALRAKSSFRSSPKPSALHKSVSFHKVHVQEYARTIGDHPDVLLGPPISIGWEPQCLEAHGIDDFETARAVGRKASKIDLRIHPNTRKRMLMSAGVDKEEIKAATRAANRVASQRKNTAAALEVPVIGLVEELTQSLKRKIKRRSWRSGDAGKLERSTSSGSLSGVSVTS
jgi:hypothetical protein